MTDEQLIEVYLSGADAHAFEALIKRYVRPVRSLIRRLTSDDVAADDGVQEVFLKAWKHMKKFDRSKSFKVWIFAISRNVAIDWLRKKKHIPFSQFDDGEGIPFQETLSGDELGAEDLFSEQETRHVIERAIAELPLAQRMVVSLRHDENMTFEEIADVIGKPMNTVKSQYRRALHHIQTLIRIPNK